MNLDILTLWLQNHWMALAFILISLPSIAYMLATGWDFVPYRYMGVVYTFNRIPEKVEKDGTKSVDLAQCGRKEGPVFLFPWQYMRNVEMADIILTVTANNLTTGGDAPQKMSMNVAINIQFVNPARTVHSVVDRNPIQEFGPNIQAALVAAALRKTPGEHLAKDSSLETAESIHTTLSADPIAARWGIGVNSVRISNLRLSDAYMGAQEKVVIAYAEGESLRIAADARAQAELTQMNMELQHAEDVQRSDARDVALWLKQKQTEEEIHQRYADGKGNATVIVGGGDGENQSLLKTLLAARPKDNKKDGGS